MRILAPLAGFILVLHATFAFAAPLTLSPFVTGLESPIDIVNAADGSGRLFVLEKRGRIRVVRNGALVATPMLDIEDIVLGGEERGLLGIAFHPRFATTRYLYVNYTRVPDGATVVERYTVPADTPDVADPASGTPVLVIAQPYANHNGGAVRFGRDGYLYVGMGDGGSGNDPQNRAQDPNNLLGKILRLDVDGGTPYAIPPGNMFTANLGRREIWAMGVRNPWRLAFDPRNGDLWFGDVGQDQREEVDFAAFGAAPKNFGWRVMEGTRCTNAGRRTAVQRARAHASGRRVHARRRLLGHRRRDLFRRRDRGQRRALPVRGLLQRQDVGDLRAAVGRGKGRGRTTGLQRELVRPRRMGRGLPRGLGRRPRDAPRCRRRRRARCRSSSSTARGRPLLRDDRSARGRRARQRARRAAGRARVSAFARGRARSAARSRFAASTCRRATETRISSRPIRPSAIACVPRPRNSCSNRPRRCTSRRPIRRPGRAPIRRRNRSIASGTIARTPTTATRPAWRCATRWSRRGASPRGTGRTPWRCAHRSKGAFAPI
jgi:hypothetical protein